MAVEISIPSDLWEDDSQAVITNWLVNDGATVDEGSLLAEIMVEKVQLDIHSPARGKLSILRVADDIVSKGDVIGNIS